MSELSVIHKIKVNDESGTAQLAARLAPFLDVEDIITLNGTLGAGKTAFARALIRALTEAPIEVPSPTFNLLLTYESQIAPIYHYDFYRLEDPEEVWELDIEEAFQEGITIIEWVSRLEDLAPENVLNIEINIPDGEPEGVREFVLSGDPVWQDRLKNLEKS